MTGEPQADVGKLARDLADSLRLLPAKDRPSTVAVLRIGDSLYEGASGSPVDLHPDVQQALDAIPANLRSDFHGKCAEPKSLSAAVHAGDILSGGEISTAKVRPPGNNDHSAPIAPCSSCVPLLQGYEVVFREHV